MQDTESYLLEQLFHVPNSPEYKEEDGVTSKEPHHLGV